MHFVALADAWASWLESIVGVFSFGTVSDSPYIELAKKKIIKTPLLVESPGTGVCCAVGSYSLGTLLLQWLWR